MNEILVVDDEPAICWALKELFASPEYRVTTAATAEEGLAFAESKRPQVVFLDIRLPRMDGIAALNKFLEFEAPPKVIMMTAFGDLETAVSAIQNRAFDYLIKPFSLETARKACLSALAAASIQPTIREHSPSNSVDLIGKSPPMQQIFRQIALFAASDLPVLITGETGTGKENVARALHQYSHRKDEPFIPIAPVSFSKDLIESELFGHVRGAYTGAHQSEAGWFERAGKGTIFLDEIGDLPIGLQVKLLRVLENGEYLRIGDSRFNYSHARLVTATNQDLRQAVAEGRFREDLYYRLNAAHIVVPPLRDRLEDIPELCDHFLRKSDPNLSVQSLTPEVLQVLQQRQWPGNVRELKNLVQRAAMLSGDRAISVEDFPDEPQQLPEKTKPAENSPAASVSAWLRELMDQNPEVYEGQIYSKFLAEFEQPLLLEVLASVHGNKAKAAEVLGMHRSTLRERLRRQKGCVGDSSEKGKHKDKSP
jgi:two-component system nitrogen regulation response regulator GlnG